MVNYVFAALGGHQFAQMAMVRPEWCNGRARGNGFTLFCGSDRIPEVLREFELLKFAVHITVVSSQVYRAHLGVSVVQSCEGALAYYQKSADQGTHMSGY